MSQFAAPLRVVIYCEVINLVEGLKIAWLSRSRAMGNSHEKPCVYSRLCSSSNRIEVGEVWMLVKIIASMNSRHLKQDQAVYFGDMAGCTLFVMTMIRPLEIAHLST